MVRFCSLLIAALAAGSFAAADPMTATDQIRETGVLAELDTGEEVVSDSDSEAAPGFGAFSSDIDALITAEVIALAAQESDISSMGMSGSGEASAEAPGSSGVPLGDAGSTFFAEFTVPATIDFVLTGSLLVSRDASASGLADISLDGPGGNIFSDSLSDDGLSPFAAGGTLDPGTYTLSLGAFATVTESGDTSSASWDFELTFVPEPSGLAALGLVGLMLRGLRRSALVA
jgi:hypothetical protein